MKLVALTQRLVEQKDYKEVRDALDVQWGSLCRLLNLVPIALPTTADVSHLFRTLPIDGVILTGGNDLSTFSDDPLSVQRDRFENQVLDRGLKKHIPVLGVCRGMQFIAEHFGVPCEKIEGHAGSRHALNISKKSAFEKELSKMPDVNSYHNYGIRKTPKGFIAAATSSDGVVEAMEQPKMKIFAQMWHPEREQPFLQAQVDLLKRFFKS